MDIENGKASDEMSLPHSFCMENDNLRDIIPTRIHLQDYNKGECSSRFKNLARDSFNNIIETYNVERLTKKCNDYSNQYLCRSNGEHVLLHRNADRKHSVQNLNNYIDSQYFTVFSNKDKHVSRINGEISKPSRKLNEIIIPKVTQCRADQKNMKFYKQTGLTSKEKLCADKTTYCRPVINLYNKEFIYKTIEKNSKLKQLVKNLEIARKREKEIVTWNNFINDLKNKHYPNYNDSQRTHLPQVGCKQYFTSRTIDDYNNTRTKWQQSRPCRHLLQDLYEGYDHPSRSLDVNHKSRGNKIHPPSTHYSLPYNTDSFCYPTSSQGRLIMLERERRRNEYQRYNRLPDNTFQYENNHGIKKYSERNLARKRISRNIYSFNNNKSISKTCIENASSQTNRIDFNLNICENKATNKTENLLINELIQTFNSDKKIEEDHPDTEHNMKDIYLVNIENKIETLISLVNNFINELKSNRKLKKSKAASVTCEMNNNTNKKVKITKSDIVDKVGAERRDESVYDEIFNETSESTLPYSNFYPCTKPSKIDDILTEIDKFCSKDNIPFKNQHCSVNIIFEVPTKDCSTEVTKSLSKQHSGAKVEAIEKISTHTPTPMQQMTIAVNTDPFGFLTLLRISTEAVMRLLSNMPNINYHSYLGLLPFPQITRKAESNYICNICGAAFNKPSALSDHIQEHNLGKTRDCCVCRHVLDMSRIPPKLFKCKFCGQRFTRAYCCELHQQRCAQRLGLIPDVASSLILLR